MAQKIVSTIHKQRINTANNWIAGNPTLQVGQIGIEGDTLRLKIGDGSTAWNSLAYAIDDYFYGQNEVTTLTSLPIDKRLVIANITTATSLSLSGNLPIGLDLHIKAYNAGASDITQPLPTIGEFESKDGDGTNIETITIPANGSAEINILSTVGKYIIKTDA